MSRAVDQYATRIELSYFATPGQQMTAPDGGALRREPMWTVGGGHGRNSVDRLTYLPVCDLVRVERGGQAIYIRPPGGAEMRFMTSSEEQAAYEKRAKEAAAAE